VEKINIYFVSGFGYSGSTAAADYLLLYGNRNAKYVRESILLKLIFDISLSLLTLKRVNIKKQKKYIKKIILEDDCGSNRESLSVKALIERFEVDVDQYMNHAKSYTRMIAEIQLENGFIKSGKRSEIINKTSIFLNFLFNEINKNSGICILDNVINPYNIKALEVLDVSIVGKLYFYTVYRSSLKDQFIEQIIRLVRGNEVSYSYALKSHFRYLYIKLRKNLGFSKNSNSIAIIPTGIPYFINQFSMKLYWRLFIGDLTERVFLFKEHCKDVKDKDTLLRVFSFEEFVSNNSLSRESISLDVKNKKSKTSIFDHQKSQKNINLNLDQFTIDIDSIDNIKFEDIFDINKD
jgi:hypothetical protein